MKNSEYLDLKGKIENAPKRIRENFLKIAYIAYAISITLFFCCIIYQPTISFFGIIIYHPTSINEDACRSFGFLFLIVAILMTLGSIFLGKEEAQRKLDKLNKLREEEVDMETAIDKLGLIP